MLLDYFCQQIISFSLAKDSSGESALGGDACLKRALSRQRMRPEFLTAEERRRAEARLSGIGFTGVAQMPSRPDFRPNPAESDFDSIPSSISTSGTFVSVQQTPSGNVFDHDFDTLRSSLERRNLLERGGFSNEMCTKCR